MKRRTQFTIAALGIFGLLAAATLYAFELHQSDRLDPATAASIEHATSLSKAFRHASETVLPSVVLIQTRPQIAAKSDSQGRSLKRQLPKEFEDHPLLRRFFEDMPAPQSPRGQNGTGSGVIIDADGLILTNHHVVRNGGRITVRLHDGREFTAKNVLHDAKTDLALIRIEGAGELQAATIGNSDDLMIGDWVLAVGAPFGLRETVTAGIISAKARGIGITDREEFLQTDAAINPGNSGGPLVNLRGEVIGINTAISSTSGGYQGVGFAIPINLASWVSDSLVEHGHVRRSFLGVGIQPLNSDLSRQLGLNTVSGAIVTEVRPGSPAANAGLKSGDVVVEFDNRSIRNPRELQAVVERAAMNDEHTVKIIRDGETLSVKVNLQPMPENLTAAASSPKSEPSSIDELGMQLSELNADVAEQLGLADSEGVLCTSVKPGSPADAAGLKAPFAVLRVGRENVNSVEEVREQLTKLSDSSSILLLVNDGESQRFVVVAKS